jgi:PBSX family phage portal protein
MAGLAKLRAANSHHGSCLLFRRNMLASVYQPSPAFGLLAFRALALDFLTFGNCYLWLQRNILGQVIGLLHLPALNMRVRADGSYRRLLPEGGQALDFPARDVLHLFDYDCMQNVYGLPDWLGGLQSCLLNENATLFRRRYYVNGAHAGFIFYTSDASLDVATQEALKQKIRDGKGVGNFKSLYIHIPNGKEKSVQIIPIGDIGQKDEFANVKNISADDVLVAHRVPGALAGVRPTAVGGDGDVTKRRLVYLQTETRPLADVFLGANPSLPPPLQFRFTFPPEAASE